MFSGISVLSSNYDNSDHKAFLKAFSNFVNVQQTCNSTVLKNCPNFDTNLPTLVMAHTEDTGKNSKLESIVL